MSVRPSVSPSGRPSGRPSVCVSVCVPLPLFEIVFQNFKKIQKSKTLIILIIWLFEIGKAYWNRIHWEKLDQNDFLIFKSSHNRKYNNNHLCIYCLSVEHWPTLRLDACPPAQLIKESKESKTLIFFDFLINLEVTYTSYLKEGQCKTDRDDIVLGHMATIPFPVLCKCRVLQRAKTKGLKRAKTTK